jgi:hypothetical protein
MGKGKEKEKAGRGAKKNIDISLIFILLQINNL